MPALHPNAPQCQHVRTNGIRCGSPSMRNRRLCYYHHRTSAPPKPRPADLPSLEDGHAIQLGIANVLRKLALGAIEYRAAYLTLYGYRLALRNLNNLKSPYAPDVITVDPAFDPDNAGLVSEPATFSAQQDLAARGAFDPAKIAEYESIAAAIAADKLKNGVPLSRDKAALQHVPEVQPEQPDPQNMTRKQLDELVMRTSKNHAYFMTDDQLPKPPASADDDKSLTEIVRELAG